jgi:hypothetical protein
VSRGRSQNLKVQCLPSQEQWKSPHQWSQGCLHGELSPLLPSHQRSALAEKRCLLSTSPIEARTAPAEKLLW